MPCFYCGVRLKKSGPAMKTRDHVVPKSQGGLWTVDACLKCNQDKADFSLEEFRRRRGGIEFFGEMRERLVNEATSWIVEGPEDKSVAHHQRIAVLPEPIQRPFYEVTLDLSNSPQIDRSLRTKKDRKKIDNGVSTYTAANFPPDLLGVKFGALTVVGRITGKWVVECMCGAIDHRSSKAVLNPANTFDACIDCRRPVGDLREAIWKECGVRVTWEDCFQHIYESHLEKVNEINTIRSTLLCNGGASKHP